MYNIIKILAFEEGKKLSVYKCTKGFLTVGIGHNLDADPVLDILHRKLKLHDTITEEECNKLFQIDLEKVSKSINRNIPWFNILPEKYKIVIINMVFQLGINGTLKFKNTLQAIKENNPDKVITGMKASQWYKQTPNRVNRLIKIVQELPVPEYN